MLGLVIAASVAAPIAPFPPDNIDLANKLLPPGPLHPMGTDELGRDLLSRILHGGRISLTVGIVSTLIALSIGLVLGVLAGYSGGSLDDMFMRLTDTAIAFPRLFVLILLTSLLGPGLLTIVVGIGAFSWMVIARLVRASLHSIKRMDFVEAAHACGASPLRIATRHLLPNALAPVIVAASLGMAQAIITESGLSYLGLGMQPPTATWGTMLRNAQEQMAYAPWTAVFPGLMIFATIMALNFMADGLQDALDPRAT